MIGRTLALYFAGRFTKMVIGLFLFNLGLVGAISFIDVFSRAPSGPGFHPWRLAAALLLRAPSVAEETLPFAVLFAAMAAFVSANRRLEVVIARAAGVSAWQFLLPACLVGVLCGALATFVYNPIASSLLAEATILRATAQDNPTLQADAGSGPVWLRQTTGDGRDSIIGAAQSFAQGTRLAGVTAFVFDKTGRFIERVDASRGQYAKFEWRLTDATVTARNQTPRNLATYVLPTTLTPAQVRQGFEAIDTIPFWSLPSLISAAKRAGVSPIAYQLRYNWLLARPILLLAMVLIAAIVSLRFSRSQDLSRMILAGVAIGFVLYVLTKVARDLGSGGIVPPVIAAWLPAVVAILIGGTVLLHLEDG